MSRGGLRALEAGDAEAVLRAFASDAAMARQGTVRDLGEARAYVGRLLASGSGCRPWAVVDDELVGLVAVNVDHENRSGWFWYWMNASYRGRGWTSAAAVAVANWALGEGGLERLELGHRVNNPASARVALAAGFVHEGTERAKFLVDGQRIDVLTYGRLRTDPWPRDGLFRVPVS
ncbi:GNAT family N-acetyltransferase [Arsenicicoccus dermatophilus]|uniref:GNAT family N-acetyltransferase n=1 Tax=Arsenicicoccus dermatophilus TaxID=1076331 RepID=UPI0039173AA6